jgi:hypothetical protein
MSHKRTWHSSNVKSPAGAILMKLGGLGLFLTKNRMEKVLGPKTDPVKGQYGQK